MKISIKNKKLKRILKKVLVKVTPWRRRYVLDKIPVFTVKQICKIIDIKVPEKYKSIKNIPVHKTFLFDKLEDKENVIKKISYHNYRRPNYLRQLKFKMNRFKFGFDNQAEVLEATDEKLIQMMVEWLYGFFPIGFYYFDYLDYELYNKTIAEANTFLSRAFWWRVYKASNDGNKIKILKDKEQFNKVFHKYVNREFLNTNNCTYEEFKKFVTAHPKFFGKPVEGTGGEGAGVIRVSDYPSINELYRHSKKNHLIIEEIVKQHKDLAKFNDSAVNTIRAYSLHCADGKVRVLLANLRLSRKGKDVDNFHCGGVTCVIDPKTGIVTSDAIDRYHKFYKKHPDSDIKFKGFKIPHWDKLLKAIEECGKLIPGLRHIGWDIAITENGNIELIEGNSMPNFDVTQAADQVGKLHVYEKYILELEKLRNKENKKLHNNKKIKTEFTLKEICKIMKIRVPKEFKPIQDIPRKNITCRLGDLEENGIFFGGFNYYDNMERFYEIVTEKKPSLMFIDKEFYEYYRPPKEIKYIVLGNYIEEQGKFFNYVKEQYKVPTIAITGSIGKTTTTQFLNHIFGQKYNVFKYSGNWNTPASVANHIMNGLKAENNMYIQECGAGDLHLVERSAAMLKPDAYILTNVLPHHLNKYKTIENVFKDKTSFSKYLKKGGVLVANFDDERIANYKFPHKVISVGINTDRKVDYRAINITQNKEFLELDILHDNEKVHLKVNIVGKHNAYNMLLAYAMAKHFSISDESIQKGLLSFHTSGIRQNVRNIGGITFYVDCYNVCNDSIKATIKALEEMKLEKKNAKKIAILGGENKLGDKCEEISYQLGKEISNNKLDHIICFSLANDTIKETDYYGESKHIYKALKDNGYNNCTLITNRKDLVKKMKELLKPGDACLVKGNAELNMTMAIDEIYGTSITMDHEYIPERNKIVEENDFKMKVNDEFGKGSIVEYTGEDKQKIVIPNKINGYPVFRIGRRLFRQKEELKTIDFGNSVENIGIAAFARNNGIKQLHIPGNVKWISSYAFSNCVNLETVEIEEGLLNISAYAFSGCTNLKEITIPKSVAFIDDLAFNKIEKLTIICKEGSFAHDFAIKNNISFKVKK